MHTREADFSRAAGWLAGRSVALVYAHSFDDELLHAYYLRQRTEVLSGYADILDLLGAYPVFFNIDQFLDLCTRPEHMAQIDCVIHIPGGSLDLDLTTFIAALCGKARKPVFPANARSISLGQNKPVARRLARELGWLVPTAVCFEKPEALGKKIILKPKYAGDSFGVRVLTEGDVLAPAMSKKFMLEEFVPGYDFTTYIVFSPITGRLEVIGSYITVPSDKDDRYWFADNSDKLRSSGRGVLRFEKSKVSRMAVSTSGSFNRLCRLTCEVFEVFSLARIDFRLLELPSSQEPVEVEPCRFLEINVLPSITPSGSWQRHILHHLESHNISQEQVHPLMGVLPPMQAAMLFLLLSWLIQRDAASVTGVDQLK